MQGQPGVILEAKIGGVMVNGKLGKAGCEFGRNNRIFINEIKENHKELKDTISTIIKIALGSLLSPIFVGIILYLLLRK